MYSRFASSPRFVFQRRYCCQLSALLALALSSTLSYGQAKDLSLSQALSLATERTSSVKAFAAAVQANREIVDKSGQLPDPMVKLGVENVPINGPDRYSLSRDFMTMRRIGVEQQWVSSDKRSARVERAKRAVEMEEGNYLSNVAKVREEAAKAWLDVLYAQRALGLIRAIELEMASDVKAMQAAHKGAKATAADVVQAKMALTMANDASFKAAQELKNARTALSRWVAEPVESVEDTAPVLVSHVAHLPKDELEKYHPMVLTARRAVELADAETAVATRERRPDWTIEAGFSQRGSQYSNMVSVGISIPIPVNPAHKQDRDIAEKSALATRARLQYEDSLRELQTEIETLSSTVASMSERSSTLKSALLPAATQQVELDTAAYRTGSGSLTAVFNAKKIRLEKQLQINDLEKEAAMNWARLEFHVIPHGSSAAGSR